MCVYVCVSVSECVCVCVCMREYVCMCVSVSECVLSTYQGLCKSLFTRNEHECFIGEQEGMAIALIHIATNVLQKRENCVCVWRGQCLSHLL